MCTEWVYEWVREWLIQRYLAAIDLAWKTAKEHKLLTLLFQELPVQLCEVENKPEHVNGARCIFGSYEGVPSTSPFRTEPPFHCRGCSLMIASLPSTFRLHLSFQSETQPTTEHSKGTLALHLLPNPGLLWWAACTGAHCWPLDLHGVLGSPCSLPLPLLYLSFCAAPISLLNS